MYSFNASRQSRILLMQRRSSFLLTNLSEGGLGAKYVSLKYADVTSVIFILSVRPSTVSNSLATSILLVWPLHTRLYRPQYCFSNNNFTFRAKSMVNVGVPSLSFTMNSSRFPLTSCLISLPMYFLSFEGPPPIIQPARH